MNNLNQLEDSLWAAADNLRANSKLTSGEYCMPVLGIIFLRHATNRYNEASRQIENDQSTGQMAKRASVRADFLKRRALMLPKEARYDELLKLPKGTNLGKALVAAMEAIESDFQPLKEQLPKDYEKFESDLLEELLRVFDSEALRTASGDVFGRIYEYFLMKFAMQGAHDNGEFFTPPSLVQTIVNVIEPDHGLVFDPACGSGGMFVQSSHFIEGRGADTGHRVAFFGQEKTATTIRLAKMNLAVHGLEGDIREANTFYEDVHNLFGKCDFVMANPPFNVDMVDAEKVKDDCRLPFGLPGVNKAKKVSNGNYLWISYFYSYLADHGRAGFVMSSQASSAAQKEAEVRRKIIKTGHVDVMISIRSNFFYTRTVPCELWFFDKAKPAQLLEKVLMLDARNIYHKVNRKIYDFSPEQRNNVAAIVWLYRGQQGKYLDLVKTYLGHMCDECARLAKRLEEYAKLLADLQVHLEKFRVAARPQNAETEIWDRYQEAFREFLGAFAGYRRECSALIKEAGTYRERYSGGLPTTNDGQHGARTDFGPVAERLGSVAKQLDGLHKLLIRVLDIAIKELAAKNGEDWDSRTINRLRKDLDPVRHSVMEQLRTPRYFYNHIDWLHSRFPDAEFVDVPGLVKLVDRSDIEANDWSLTPGRYVGVALPEGDEEFDFEEALRDLHVELVGLNEEAAELAKLIQANFEELGL